MHAVVIADGRLRWEQRPDPEPGPTQLLVAVKAAGINNADLLQRVGMYPAPPGSPPDIPGMELAGEVVATGTEVTRFAPGDRVMAVVGGGAQATMTTLEQDHAIAVPDGTGWPEAGGFPEAFSTAHDALFTRGHLVAGDRVLVTGAAGGVGTAGVQLAATAQAHVVAGAPDPRRHPDLTALGASEVVLPDDVAGHGPYDVVLELIGAASLEHVLKVLATEARVVVIGVGGGGRIELDLLALMGRRASIGAATLRARDHDAKAAVARALADFALPLLASGALEVPVFATYPMAEAEAAYEAFAAGGKFGKIVLVT